MGIEDTMTTVVSVDRTEDPSLGVFWCIGEKEDDGRLWVHAVAASSLHYRAAEYGVDPQDSSTLLDIVMYERFAPVGHDDPTFVYNTDEETARLHHLSRISTAKTANARTDPNGLLSQIREHHRSNPDQKLIGEHREFCRKVRKEKGIVQ
jgi:hypothetical protein